MVVATQGLDHLMVAALSGLGHITAETTKVLVHLLAAAKFGWGQQPNRAEPEAPYGISYPGIGHLHLIKQPTKALSVLWQK